MLRGCLLNAGVAPQLTNQVVYISTLALQCETAGHVYQSPLDCLAWSRRMLRNAMCDARVAVSCFQVQHVAAQRKRVYSMMVNVVCVCVDRNAILAALWTRPFVHQTSRPGWKRVVSHVAPVMTDPHVKPAGACVDGGHDSAADGCLLSVLSAIRIGADHPPCALGFLFSRVRDRVKSQAEQITRMILVIPVVLKYVGSPFKYLFIEYYMQDSN